jgi:hypothetical protein
MGRGAMAGKPAESAPAPEPEPESESVRKKREQDWAFSDHLPVVFRWRCGQRGVESGGSEGGGSAAAGGLSTAGSTGGGVTSIDGDVTVCTYNVMHAKNAAGVVGVVQRLEAALVGGIDFLCLQVGAVRCVGAWCGVLCCGVVQVR